MSILNPNLQNVAIGFSSANNVSYALVHQKELNKGRSQFLMQHINDFGGVMSAINSVNFFLKSAKYKFKINNIATVSSQASLAGIYYMHVNKDNLKLDPKIKKLNRFLQENISNLINTSSIAFTILSIPYASTYFGYTFTVTTLALLNDYFNIVKLPYVGKLLKSSELSAVASLLSATTKVNLFFSLIIFSIVAIDNFIFAKNKINNILKQYTKSNFSFSQISQFIKDKKLDEKFQLTGKDLLSLRNASKKENPEYINTYFKNLKFTDEDIKKVLIKLEEFDPIFDDIKKNKDRNSIVVNELKKRLKEIITSSNKHSISKDLISSISHFLKDKNINPNFKKDAILELAIEGEKCETAKIDAIKKAFFKLALNKSDASNLKIATISSIQTMQESIISNVIYQSTKNRTKDDLLGMDNKYYATNNRHAISVFKAMYYPNMSGVEYDEAFLPIQRLIFSMFGSYMAKNDKTLPKYTASTLIDFLEDEVKSNAIPIADLWAHMYQWMEKNIDKNDQKKRDEFMNIVESKDATRFALAMYLRELNIIE
jgi:hypothetical protein